MKRMTEKQSDGSYRVPSSCVDSRANQSFGGEAIERLASLENALEVVEQQYDAAAKKLETLKASGKMRSATAQQLLAQKLTYSTLLTMMGVKE